MVCIYCSSDTKVTNSRLQKRSNSVWRRRHCKGCGSIFSTKEHVDYEKSIVVQSPEGAISPFLRDKLFTSIYRSCQHRETALQDTIGITDTVIDKIWNLSQDGKLNAEVIAAATMKTLKRFDQPAAISYQAFHADVL
ncbi:MAG: nrdR [Candidatus Saccharibacteria bacterium]|nr:nrdR [Candidatus Saccharibacteria bacterium]